MDNLEIMGVLIRIEQSIKSLAELIQKSQSGSHQSGCDDLIESFFAELAFLGIEVDRTSISYNEESVKNLFTYYRDHRHKITNPRAYLLKVCNQVLVPLQTHAPGFVWTESLTIEDCETDPHLLDQYSKIDFKMWWYLKDTYTELSEIIGLGRMNNLLPNQKAAFVYYYLLDKKRTG